MLIVSFTPKFMRRYKNLEVSLQNEILEKIELIKDPRNHNKLKVHKLKGRYANIFSFYVNYKIRIVFEYLSKKEAVLLTVGDHDVYK